MRAQNGSSWKQINSWYILGDSLDRGSSSLVAYGLGAARGMHRSLPMEGRGNDLGLTHRRQSGDCCESEEKGDGARMQKEAHNSGFLSSASFIPSPSLPTSLSSSPLFSRLPSPPLRSHRLSCNSRFLVCSTFMIGRGREPEAAIQASLALLKMSHVSLSQD